MAVNGAHNKRLAPNSTSQRSAGLERPGPPERQTAAPTTSLIEAAPAANWTAQLRAAFRSLEPLLRFLELDRAALGEAAIEPAEFPLLVPRGYAARMRKRDPHDPLLRQVLPLASERAPAPGFTLDPLGELARADDGVLQKYAGRALLIATAACPVHCRYCFRRHFPYAEHNASRRSWSRAIARIAADRDISEVILSGGDPLSLANHALGDLIARLEHIEHVQTLRIHTRFPIVLPERIDAGLVSVLSRSRLQRVLVVHCNHPREIDAGVATAAASLRRCGVTLLNQSVLLHRVNDDAETLCGLSRGLFAAGILPYYLHALDPVAGSAHFDVPVDEARKLVAQMRRVLPGYLVPRLARETAGQLSKTVMA